MFEVILWEKLLPSTKSSSCSCTAQPASRQPSIVLNCNTSQRSPFLQHCSGCMSDLPSLIHQLPESCQSKAWLFPASTAWQLVVTSYLLTCLNNLRQGESLTNLLPLPPEERTMQSLSTLQSSGVDGTNCSPDLLRNYASLLSPLHSQLLRTVLPSFSIWLAVKLSALLHTFLSPMNISDHSACCHELLPPYIHLGLAKYMLSCLTSKMKEMNSKWWYHAYVPMHSSQRVGGS